MFSKLSLLALAIPLVNALTLHIPENPTSSGPVTLSWTSAPGDPPTFSIELIHEAFHRQYAVANNVIPEQGSIDIVMPVVPADAGYTLQAVNVGNINDVYAETGEFVVGENSATSVSSVSQTSSRASSSVSSTSGSSSASSVPVTTRSSSTSAFGTTVTSASSSTSRASSATSQNAAATSTFGNGTPAKFSGNVGTIAAALLSAIAGAAIVIL